MSLKSVSSTEKEVEELEKKIRLTALDLIELVESRSKLTNKKGGITIKGDNGNKLTVILNEKDEFYVSDSESADDYFSESDSPNGDYRSLTSSMLVPRTRVSKEKQASKSRSFSGGEARINRLNVPKSPPNEHFRKR